MSFHAMKHAIVLEHCANSSYSDVPCTECRYRSVAGGYIGDEPTHPPTHVTDACTAVEGRARTSFEPTHRSFTRAYLRVRCL